MPRREATPLAGLGCGLGIVGLCLFALPAAGQDQGDESFESLRLFNSVLERIQSDYVDEVDQETLIRSAIKGMVDNLDAHSSYLDPEAYEDMQVETQGEFGGLGIEVTMEDGLVKVVSPIEGTPAFRRGIEPGDLITEIDGEGVVDLSLSEAVEKMRGPVDTEITLTIQRGERETFDITLTRDTITIRSVRHTREGDVGYIRVTTFNEQTASGLREALESFKEDDGLAGVVLDLRNNPGGLLDQAVEVSDIFLEEGEIVSTRGRTDNSDQRFDASAGDVGEDVRLVVLINGGSASASEIVAGAIQDHKRGVVAGTESFGKGSVQAVVPLPENGAIRMTTARYYTPSGRSIEADGVMPDIPIEQREVAADEESQDDNTSEDEEGRPPLIRSEDYQLNRAMALLEGVDIFFDIRAD